MTKPGNANGFSPQGKTFLVTGGAGFIGSHLVRHLVRRGGRVRVLDALTTGRRENLEDVWDDVEFFEGDVRSLDVVRRATEGVDYVFHLAALVSVPESVEHPDRNLEVNVVGTQNVLLAATEQGVKRVVFSSSCAVYGDHAPPHHEGLPPRASSPYAAAKVSGEQLCRAFTRVYGLPTVSLRYFNVFGPAQNPHGGYAAAIPAFIARLLAEEPPIIYGDGRQSRDFVYVQNVVEANVLACSVEAAVGEVFNIGTGQETNLLDILAMLGAVTGRRVEPVFAEPRPGDIRRSFGDISRAKRVLGYRPDVHLSEGLRRTVQWLSAQVVPS